MTRVTNGSCTSGLEVSCSRNRALQWHSTALVMMRVRTINLSDWWRAAEQGLGNKNFSRTFFFCIYLVWYSNKHDILFNNFNGPNNLNEELYSYLHTFRNAYRYVISKKKYVTIIIFLQNNSKII